MLSTLKKSRVISQYIQHVILESNAGSTHRINLEKSIFVGYMTKFDALKDSPIWWNSRLQTFIWF